MVVLYRHYDRAALDSAYNNRAAVPSHPTTLARWQARSAEVRSAPGATLDITYGPTARQRLDLFRPADRAPQGGWPTVLFFHGGYWQSLHKDSFSFLAPPITARGVALAVATYDLCPDVTMTALADQARSALAFLVGAARGLDLDPDRLVVAGHSAGGHLAALLAGDDPARRPKLAGALALSGLFDLEPIRLSYLNDALRLGSDEARVLSPQHQVASGGPPLVLAMGAAELPGFHDQQGDFDGALRAAGTPPRATIVTAGDDHFSVLDRLVDPAAPILPALLALTRP
ncbi:MAG: alpha/beta hydrolase [Alphaproteobacteria bacterium]|nr:alpha/beta hydrolase [Alphaproteobacteria bacterium]